jgi:hypothetical protein
MISDNKFTKQEQKGKILTKQLPNYCFKVSKIQNLYYKNFIKKSLKKLNYYMYYKQLLYINKAKFENSYLQGLKDLITKIFNKNIEFNIINLKYFYYNSDIFSQPLVLKLRKQRKLLKYLKALISEAKLNKTIIKKIT